MGFLNKLSPCAIFVHGRSTSLAARYNLRPTWNLKFSKCQSHSTRNFITKQVARYSSRAGKQWETSDHLLGTKGKHILWIDLIRLEYGHGKMVHYSPDDNSSQSKKTQNMIDNLRQFVEADAQKPPFERVDSVLWYVDRCDNPTAEMWQALDGLSPKHLDIKVGWNEDCHVESLNTLHHQWNDLDTLSLKSICDSNFMERWPKAFSQISFLTLDYCCGLAFIPSHIKRLKRLRILENNACDMFNYAVDNNPHFAQVLEVLEIKSTNGCDFTYNYEPQDFRDRLQKCTNLLEFDFSASYQDSLDKDLASYIPLSIEKLTLCFTRSLPFLHDIDEWINHTSDPTWLPHLKSFQLTVDPESHVQSLKRDEKTIWTPWIRNLENPQEFSREEFDQEFERKRSTLYDALKSTRPFIDLTT